MIKISKECEIRLATNFLDFVRKILFSSTGYISNVVLKNIYIQNLKFFAFLNSGWDLCTLKIFKKYISILNLKSFAFDFEQMIERKLRKIIYKINLSRICQLFDNMVWKINFEIISDLCLSLSYKPFFSLWKLIFIKIF